MLLGVLLPLSFSYYVFQFCRSHVSNLPIKFMKNNIFLFILSKSRCIIIFALVCICSSPMLSAQNAVIKVNLAALLQKNIGGGVEVKLSNRWTAEISANTVGKSTGISGDTSSVYSRESGFVASPELRYYFGGEYAEAPRGFFVGPNALYERAKLTYSTTPDTLGNVVTTTGDAGNWGIGLIVGSQWLFGDRFAVELFFNPYYNIPNVSGDITTNSASNAFIRNYKDQKSGFSFKRIGLSIGVAF